MSRYAQAIDLQTSWHEWVHGGQAEKVWAAIGSDRSSHIKGYPSRVLGTAPERPFYELILGKGTAIFVSKELCEYLEHLVATLPDDASFQHTMLPTPVGFVAFERPLRLPIVGSTEMSIPMSALGWVALRKRGDGMVGSVAMDTEDYENGTRTQCCVFVNNSTDPRNPPGIQYGGFFPYSFYGFDEGDNVADRVQSFEDGFGSNPHHSASEGAEGKYGNDLQYHEMRYFLTLLLLMEQRLLTHKNYTVDRATRRRAARAGIPGDHVKVIHFRRYENPDVEANPSGGTANYSHRFMVRPHWRQQFYPSLSIHKPKWVLGYIKGAAHLPLKYDERTVMAVIR